MVADKDLKSLSSRLISLRTSLLSDFPFYGRLLLHLQFGYADCGTAYTDMRKIIFDPDFTSNLTDEEVRFVLLHEVMHCVLHHCTRGRSLNPEIYNIACDIVVNSLILETIHAESFCVDGEPVMHLAPDGKEGKYYSAEEIYDMLFNTFTDMQSLQLYGSICDDHTVWRSIDSVNEDKWDQHVRSAIKSAGTASGIPYGLKRHLSQAVISNTLDWRLILHNFIQPDRSDFTYERPDPRFQGDIIMPSFMDNMYGERIENIWFLVDTSGSISDEALTESYYQIKQAVEQFDNLNGLMSFFDSEVSDPIPFSSIEDIECIEPIGGGGTSFVRIFEYYKEHFSDENKPQYTIILTDGYAPFPSDEQFETDKTLWLIVNSNITPPFGNFINLNI